MKAGRLAAGRQVVGPACAFAAEVKWAGRWPPYQRRTMRELPWTESDVADCRRSAPWWESADQHALLAGSRGAALLPDEDAPLAGRALDGARHVGVTRARLVVVWRGVAGQA